MAEIKGHTVTSDLRELAALVGSSWPYETAAGVLKQLSGVHLSDERLRPLTNEQGSLLAQQQREGKSHTAKQGRPEVVQVGLDGGWLSSREQTAGMEGKIGVVASKPGSSGQTGATSAHQAAIGGNVWPSRRGGHAHLCGRL